MIRTEQEYREAIRRLERERQVIDKQRKELARKKLSEENIELALAPLLSFHLEFREEVEWYERVRRQDFTTLSDIRQVGKLLIALRIASGLTQKELAKCLGVAESQVSRDERNEYHGITIERVLRILDVFGVHLKTQPEISKPLDREKILAGAAH